MTLVCQGSIIEDYTWQEEESSLYILSGNSWWRYSTETMTVEPVAGTPQAVDSAISHIEQAFRAEVGEEYDLLRYSLSVSPSDKKLLYWKFVNPKIAQTPSVGAEDILPNEDNVAIANAQQDVFLMQEGIDKPVYLGKIPGAITSVHWFADEKKVVLEMFAFSPYYLWAIDIELRSFSPLLSRYETDNAPKFALLDISPDGDQILYQTSLSDRVFVKNLKNSSVQRLNEFPRNASAWWLPDGQHIIAVLHTGVNYEGVYIYDFKTGTMTLLTSEIKSDAKFLLIEASEDDATLVNIDDRDANNIQIKALHFCLK